MRTRLDASFRASSTEESNTTSPLRNIAMRSQTRSTSDSTCDDMKTVRPRLRIGQQFIERFLHEGIETFRGFVQDQQERVGLKRLYQAEFSFHASAVLAQLSREIAIA